MRGVVEYKYDDFLPEAPSESRIWRPFDSSHEHVVVHCVMVVYSWLCLPQKLCSRLTKDDERICLWRSPLVAWNAPPLMGNPESCDHHPILEYCWTTITPDPFSEVRRKLSCTHPSLSSRKYSTRIHGPSGRTFHPCQAHILHLTPGNLSFPFYEKAVDTNLALFVQRRCFDVSCPTSVAISCQIPSYLMLV